MRGARASKGLPNLGPGSRASRRQQSLHTWCCQSILSFARADVSHTLIMRRVSSTLSRYTFDCLMCFQRNLSSTVTGKLNLSSSALKTKSHFEPMRLVAFWKSHSLQKTVSDHGDITRIYLGHVGSEKEV